MEDELDAVHLRGLAAKCRRLAKNMTDPVTLASLRQMAGEYDALAASKERQMRGEPSRPRIGS